MSSSWVFNKWFVPSSLRLLLIVPGIPLDLRFFRVVPGRGLRKKPELAEDPGDSIGRLGADAQPVLEAVLLQTDLLHPVLVGDRVVGSQDFEELAVPGGPGVGGDHPVKGGVGPAEAL